MEETSELMKCLGYRKNRRIPPFLSQKKVHITLPAQLLNFFFDGEFTLQLCGLPFLLWLILVTAFLVTSNDAVQAIVTFSLILVQKMVTNLHTVFLLFLCEHTWDLPGANFVIFQHYHHFQCTGADIQLSTESPCGNPPICADMLTETFCGVTGMSGHPERGSFFMSLLPLVKRTTYPSCCSHPLFDLRKHSASIDECHWVPFFLNGEAQLTHLCSICTSRSVSLLLCCRLLHSNKMLRDTDEKVQSLLPYHQHGVEPLTWNK